MKLSAFFLLFCLASTKLVFGAEHLRGSSDAAVDGESDDYEQVLRHLKSENEIRESYILQFVDSIENVEDECKKIVKKHGLELGFVYDVAIKGCSVKKLKKEKKKEVEAEQGVMLVEVDQVFTADAQTIPWGIPRVTNSTNPPTYTGNKVAWVIDTGIDLDHPDLNVDLTKCKYFIETSCDDGNGHGSHVAGTIAAKNNAIGVVGVAPNAKLIPVKVLNSSGSGYTSGVIAGVNHVAANGKPGDVANMSLGGPGSTTLDNAVSAAANKGIYFTLSAGNSGADASSYSPARVNGKNMFTISAIDNTGTFAYFSNYGSSVDYAAPGVSVNSTYKNGGYATLSGTSMAAPHAAGVLLMTNGLPKKCGTVIGDKDSTPDPIISVKGC